MVELNNDQSTIAKLFRDLCSEYEQPFVIDVGSHVGTALLAATARENISGWAFEPHSAVCEVLNRNLALNSISDRIVVFREALSHFPGRRILKSPHNDKDSGLSCIGQTNYSPHKEQYVDVVRLDDVSGVAGLEAVDIINIDTEGSELFVLIGATETINKHKPDILLKVNWGNLNQLDVYINNLTDYLELLGYQGHWAGTEDMLFRHPYRKTIRKKPYFVDKPDNDGLKVAIVKQRYDVFGPWCSTKYERAQPFNVMKKWPSKYSYLEMTHLFQADWLVLPFCHDSKNVRQKIDFHQQTFDDNMECLPHVTGMHLDDYDVVISLDPILRPPRGGQTLYAYFQNEHHHSEYTQSVRKPLPGYDLFLDHMMKAPVWVYDLPQPVAFPYPRDPFVSRGMCSGERADAIWCDKRFVMMLTHGNEAFHRGGFENTIISLEKRFRSRVMFRHLDFEDMTRWGDPLDYMREMSGCAYYVNLIACGAGQGLCDAASLGLICFGSAKLPYHKAICHPFCLCQDLSELEWKLSMVRGSSDLQQEIHAWQDAALSDVMVTQPLRILQAAVDLKRRHSSSASVAPAPSDTMITELDAAQLPQEIARINSTKLKQLAQSEYEKGNYEEAIHRCRQALWFDKTDHELFYLIALAYYAVKDHTQALSRVAECLKINELFRPAMTLKQVLLHDDSGEDGHYAKCRARVLYLVYNRFSGFDKESDGNNIETYNAILDELLQNYIKEGDTTNQLLIQHHKMRLNRIAAL
ncbi:MAG: FkbM family methyltransferase [Geobacteraceae bacterium]|nr:FkbM family methyltransferase [Geobacteraceae bacterium]